MWDPAECAIEVERCAAKGANGITFPDAPTGLGLPSFHTPDWDATFAAAAEAGMPLCMHFGGSRVLPYVAPDAPQAAVTAVFGMTLFNSMCELAMSTVFKRHPKLKIAYSEGGIGWVPYALMRMDQVWETYRQYPLENNVDPDQRPSDVVREHIWSCFIDDPVGLRERHTIGVDHSYGSRTSRTPTRCGRTAGPTPRRSSPTSRPTRSARSCATTPASCSGSRSRGLPRLSPTL